MVEIKVRPRRRRNRDRWAQESRDIHFIGRRCKLCGQRLVNKGRGRYAYFCRDACRAKGRRAGIRAD